MANQRPTAPSSTGVLQSSGNDADIHVLSLSPSRSADDLIDGGGTARNSTSCKFRTPRKRSSGHKPLSAAPCCDVDHCVSTRVRRDNRNNWRDVSGNSSRKPSVAISLAVFLWYLLGVISISSSKVLLSAKNIPPLVLTVQQLIIGVAFLRILLRTQTDEKDKDRLPWRGLQFVPMRFRGTEGDNSDLTKTLCPEKGEARILARPSGGPKLPKNEGTVATMSALIRTTNTPLIKNDLFLAAIYFGFGFLLTNYGFQSGSAAFVETVKAAEPITSASVAVAWKIERLRKEEVISLTGIVAGVVLSASYAGDDALTIQSQSLMTKCFIIFCANLCFSFRSLHQKLFRATPQGHASVMDDLNLQYRMQQICVLVFILPALLGHAIRLPKSVVQSSLGGSMASDFLRYILLSLVNGLAFASYNLASTYVLTQISVVHHAVLNCIRRVFAIVVTCIIFRLKITLVQIIGICLAVGGFFSYTYFKTVNEKRDKRRKELRNQWGGIMVNVKKRKPIDKNLSLLPMNNVFE